MEERGSCRNLSMPSNTRRRKSRRSDKPPIVFLFQDQDGLAHSVRLHVSEAARSPFLGALSRTRLGPEPKKTLKRVINVERSISKADATVVAEYLRAEDHWIRRTGSLTSAMPNPATEHLSKLIAYRRSPAGYVQLSSHADFFMLPELIHIVDQSRRSQGFETLPVDEVHPPASASPLPRCAGGSRRALKLLARTGCAPPKRRLPVPCRTCAGGCGGQSCLLRRVPAVQLNRALLQKDFEVKVVAQKAASLADAQRVRRVRTERSHSDGDVLSVISSVTAVSTVTTKSDLRAYRGAARNARCGGGVPVAQQPYAHSGISSRKKRKKRLKPEQRRRTVKKRAVTSALRGAFTAAKFYDQIKFWASVDSQKFEDLFQVVVCR